MELSWCRVEYEKERQIKELRYVIGCWIDYLRRERPVGVSRLSQMMADDLIQFLCRFKKCGYKDENEWRLVYTPKAGNVVEEKTRTVGTRQVRYIELALSVEISSRGAETWKLPIQEVMAGPNLQSTKSLRLIDSLLKANGYLTVRSSTSTYA